MAREENKNKYSNIEHVRTNMLWMDIKIVDPEMEALMKQINEEQTRLKEALREKLRLMKYDNDIILKENEQTKEWLRSKGIQFEEKKNNTTVKEENEVKVKDEPADTETNENEYHEEKVSARSLKEINQTKGIVNTSMEETKNTDTEVRRLDGNEENRNDVNNKNDILKECSKVADKEEHNPSINDQTTTEESGIATRTRRSTQVNAEVVEDIPLSEKKSKRGMKRRRLLRKYRASLKRKKTTMEKMDEVQSNGDTKGESRP